VTLKSVNLNDLDPNALLTAGEVAALFKVNPKTVTRWKWPENTSIRTPGNHLRFRVWFVKAMLEGGLASLDAYAEDVRVPRAE
jgi:hypothetical protein